MLTYFELLAGYNKVKKKLLAKNFFEKNLDNIHESDRISILLDFKFYNPILTYRENLKVKLDFAKKINYPGIIIVGYMEKNMLYKREVLINKKRHKLYYPSGLLKSEEEFNYVYNFKENEYIKKICFDKKILFTLSLPYKTLKERFAKFLSIAPFLPKYISLIEHKDDHIELTILDDYGRLYITNYLLAQNFKVQTYGNRLWIW